MLKISAGWLYRRMGFLAIAVCAISFKIEPLWLAAGFIILTGWLFTTVLLGILLLVNKGIATIDC